jgi:hypothetical protein
MENKMNEITPEIQAVLDLAVVAGVPVVYKPEEGEFIFGRWDCAALLRASTANNYISPTTNMPLASTEDPIKAAKWISTWRPIWKTN